MTENQTAIQGGSNFCSTIENTAVFWAFYVSQISADGKDLTLTRSGYGHANSNWQDNINLVEIIGIKY